MVKARQLDIPPSIKPYRLPNPAAPVQPGVAGSYWPSPHLLGGWLGARGWLAERGITASVNYVGEVSANLGSGTSRKARYADQWAFGLKVATPNILGGPPAMTQITITHRGGEGINAANGVETLQLPAEIYGRGDIWRLTQASYRAGRGAFEMKLGRIPVGDDFASAGCEFQTLYVCGATPGQISPDYWHNYPVAPWGIRFKQGFGKALFAQIGAYQVSAANIDPLHGFRLGLKDTTGVLVPAEIDWILNSAAACPESTRSASGSPRPPMLMSCSTQAADRYRWTGNAADAGRHGGLLCQSAPAADQTARGRLGRAGHLRQCRCQ
jgi:porin